MTQKTLIWFQNDLRLSDNQALDYAYKNNHEVIFLYIYDQSIPIGSASKWFLHQSLHSLKADLKKKFNANLVIKSGDSQEILHSITQKYNIDAILWNRVYEPQSLAKYTQISAFFKEKDITTKSFNSSLLFEPSHIQNLAGSYFKVFTPFWKKCLTKINALSPPCQIADSIKIVTLEKDEECDLETLNLEPKNPNWANNWPNLYQITEENAHDLAESFMKNRMLDYKTGRDFPATKNTSFLSPYLHFGLISPKQIYFKASIFSGNAGLDHFLSEIGWREFSYHLLYHFPELPTKNFKSRFDNFTWDNNPENLKKWQTGQTGFPLIDAGMRQLYQTGWMHNRVRMVVASFLIKNLLIDWRIGQAWFWDCLVDADLAANSASWQWVAGSGADASPYFRIFNPVTQSQKFDPQGEYIRKWVPEIAHLTNKEIHFPTNTKQYPKPMVDLKSSRNKALEIYKMTA